MYGWMGKILKLDLKDKRLDILEVPESTRKSFLGGRGLGVKLYTEMCSPEIDPFHPDNLLIFMTGPLTGVFPTSGRYQIISRSPLTGTICDASSGGIWGAQLKKAGFDGLIISGKADQPIFIEIRDNKIDLRDARDLWGLDTHQTINKIKETVEKGSSIATIGPAAENMILYSGIMNDHDRYAGRGGLGAVMGSKNLKAIVIKGTGEVAVKYPEKLKSFWLKLDRLIDKNPITGKSLQLLGTPVLMNIINDHGMLATRNFQEGVFNDAEGISGEKMSENKIVKKSACFKCPIACGRVSKIENKEIHGPEFETTWAFGAQIDNNDLDVVIKANSLCNKLGLDTISCGNTIGCAMELSQNGLLNDKISWGDGNTILKLINDIVSRKGIGKELALGAKRMAEKYHRPELAMHVKGLELPAYDPRGVQGQALAYATNNRGGCHIKAYMIGPEILGSPVFLDRFSTKGKPEILILMQDISAVVDSLILCRFLEFAVSIDSFAEMFNIVTGYEYTGSDLIMIGKRIYSIERKFNCDAGFSREDDNLPERFTKEELKEGASRNRTVKMDEMLDKYYELRGWDNNGIPKKETLKNLKI